MRALTRILRSLKSYVPEVVLNVVFNLLHIVFSVFTIASIMPFLDIIFFDTPFIDERPAWRLDFETLKATAYYHIGQLLEQYDSKTAGLVFVAALVVVTAFFRNLFRYLAAHFMVPIRTGVVRDLRNELGRKVLHLPLAFFGKERKGDLVSRMTSDVVEVEHGILSVLEILFKEPATILIFLGVLFMVSVKLTLVVFGLVLVVALFVGTIGRSLKRQGLEGQRRLGYLTSLYDEIISNIRVIKAFNAEEYKEAQFRHQNDRWRRLMNTIMRKRFLSSPLTEFLAFAVFAAVIWVGGQEVLEGRVNASSLFFYLLSFGYIIAPAKSFASAYYNIQKASGAIRRIHEITEAEAEVVDDPGAVEVRDLQDAIEISDLRFAYNNYDDKRILDGIDLTVRRGDMVALVGPSGAGKTTLVDLLPRFYEVQEGSITIDGTDIRDIRTRSLRDLMGVVTQQSILFNDTVHANIAFGLDEATRNDVIEAAKVANAHDFIEGLEHGYDTVIGDQGNMLSGGQRQRLTIARAVLKNPPVLILDEATSALDSESEKLVQDALIKLMKNRTSIVIAHRLSTIQYADEIVVMDEGRIVEKGNHISLMAKDGVYRKLVELQEF